jgi:hypothetical protein
MVAIATIATGAKLNWAGNSKGLWTIIKMPARQRSCQSPLTRSGKRHGIYRVYNYLFGFIGAAR